MKTVLCYGDSNTYGYNPETGGRYPRDVRYPGRLQALLGGEYNVIEEGCNGRTTLSRKPGEEWKNGLDYLRPCLNSHKPVDIVIMMLGSNDLKEMFHLTAPEIARGAGVLVDTIKELTAEKQGFVPKVILVSPPEIGPGIKSSPFGPAFSEDAVRVSKELAANYRKIADEKGCIFLDAAQYIAPSELDSLHLTPGGHGVLADELAKLCRV